MLDQIDTAIRELDDHLREISRPVRERVLRDLATRVLRAEPERGALRWTLWANGTIGFGGNKDDGYDQVAADLGSLVADVFRQSGTTVVVSALLNMSGSLEIHLSSPDAATGPYHGQDGAGCRRRRS